MCWNDQTCVRASTVQGRVQAGTKISGGGGRRRLYITNATLLPPPVSRFGLAVRR